MDFDIVTIIGKARFQDFWKSFHLFSTKIVIFKKVPQILLETGIPHFSHKLYLMGWIIPEYHVFLPF